jgi:phosphoribosylglycinamide formyltransferase-1
MKNVIVLVSGGGTNLQAILDEQDRGNVVGGRVSCVVSSNPEAYALERARKHGVKTRVLPRKDFPNAHEYSKALLAILDEEHADLVVLAGFMTILDEVVTDAYPYRIINVHPALIPSFCGEGYYGIRVHQAVLDYGVKVSGATIHFVNEKADAGAIIMQGVVDVQNDDTPETLQRRIMENVEWKLLPKAVSLFCQDRITVKDGKAYVVD